MSDYFLRELKAAREKYAREAEMHKEKSSGRDYFSGFSTAQNLFVAHIDRMIKDWLDAEPVMSVVICKDCQFDFTLSIAEEGCPRCGSKRH